MSCNCNNKKQRPKYLDLDVIYTGDLTECNGFTIRPKSNLRTILDVLLKGCGLNSTDSKTNFWFSPEIPQSFEADENDYLLLGDGKIYQYNGLNWIDTGINLGGGISVINWGDIQGDINNQNDLIELITQQINSIEVGHGIVKSQDGTLELNSDPANLYQKPFFLVNGVDNNISGLVVTPGFSSLNFNNNSIAVDNELVALRIGNSQGIIVDFINLKSGELILSAGGKQITINDLGIVLDTGNGNLEMRENDVSLVSYDNNDASSTELTLNNSTGIGQFRSSKNMPLEYSGDYSSNYTERSLTDKSYVDSRIWSGTQAQYDALPTKDPNVLYLII